MTVANWHRLGRLAKAAALASAAAVCVGGGLAVQAWVLHWGLKLPISLPRDLLLWPEAALAGYSDPLTVKWIRLAGMAGLLPTAALVAAILKARPKVDLHGTAAFAREREIAAAGMRARAGLIAGFTGPLPSPHYGKPVSRFGQIDEEHGRVKVEKKGHLNARNLLTYGGPEHMLLYAPTRSGKGVGVVVPNLLNWPDSAVVLDIKKENWQLTAGFRKAGGQEVFLFDPLDPEGRTHRWNPLGHVRRGTAFQVEDLQRLADLFIPVASKDPFFDRAAQTAFVGVGGYLAETPELPFTLGELYRQLTLTPSFAATFRARIEERKDSARPLTLQTVATLNDFLSKSENTFESVKSTITANLGLFANPILDRATAASDFDFADLRRKRMTIHVGITPNNLGRLGPLLNLFFQSCVDANMQDLPEHNPALKHRVLLCMDEFAAVGELPAFKRGIGYFAGYGLKVLTIVQTPAQLADIYGSDGAEAYMDNAGITVVFTPKGLKEARNLSERLGTHGAEAVSASRSKLLTSRNPPTISTSEQKRSLMMPQELLQLDQSEAIILAAGHPPIRAKKIRFYAEEALLERSRIPPPEIPPLRADASADDVRSLRDENRRMREDLSSLEAEVRRIAALKLAQAANVATGQPAEVPMTDEEIANPSTISFDRLALAGDNVRAKIKSLAAAGTIGTKEGVAAILGEMGVAVPEEKPAKPARAPKKEKARHG
ncbi:type IV secretory system conjugative DNA transfer family protein [Cereibacter sphaeroides]|uniref:type IV secretory system conjugative DNA transfer family protein n=1 Tax=Cereibacter sphaeroides TaxID=1063 RepID=UPI001F1D03D8|nr:type IV secretory system conjugative DNA transfer family protein [Cereibacter sphaeroides]MCE6967522.1 type IV secretory system conjugative DNA transfer family protein [Cereibacter sphaeroides]